MAEQLFRSLNEVRVAATESFPATDMGRIQGECHR